MGTESRTLNALCQNKDMAGALQDNIDDLFITHKDVWGFVRDQWQKYHVVPDVSVVQEKFPDFEVEKVTAPTQFYLDELRNDFVSGKIRNVLIDKGSKIGDVPGEQVLSELYAELSKLNRFTENVRDLDITDFDNAASYYEAQAKLSMSMGGSPGIPTGLKAIDACYHTGMAPGHLLVLIGWPSRGKTWLSSLLACNAWSQGFSPLILSLEMSPEAMRDRIYTIMGSGLFGLSKFSRGDINIDDFNSWGKKNLTEKPRFTIVSSEGESEITPMTGQAKIEQYRPNLVIADYHQLFDDNTHSNNEVQRNRNISRQFKRLAMSNKLPVIDITAATMEDVSDQDNPPLLSQVAWSKAIEYDADMAMAVHKRDNSNIIEVVCRKNKYGPKFALNLDWDIENGLIDYDFDNLND